MEKTAESAQKARIPLNSRTVKFLERAVEYLRQYQPNTRESDHPGDEHPDHPEAAGDHHHEPLVRESDRGVHRATGRGRRSTAVLVEFHDLARWLTPQRQRLPHGHTDRGLALSLAAEKVGPAGAEHPHLEGLEERTRGPGLVVAREDLDPGRVRLLRWLAATEQHRESETEDRTDVPEPMISVHASRRARAAGARDRER